MNALSLTRATASDSDVVFEWRNDPQTRAASVSQAPVTWEEHIRWYSRMLDDPARHLYIAKIAKDRVGLCRFDVQGERCEISINLNPQHRGRGLAKPILSSAIAMFAAEYSGIRTLTATIRPENAASAKTFLALGFVRDLSDGGLDHYVLEMPIG